MDQKNRGEGIDPFSFRLGMINCFAEMVACGVKQLAISPPLLPAEYDALAPYSEQIVKGFGIASYLENSLMVTLLQSPEFTQNKCSILYYKNEKTLVAYLELKERQARLIASDGYDAKAQKELSAAFMTLLSYPPDVIASKLSGSHPDPFILVGGVEKKGENLTTQASCLACRMGGLAAAAWPLRIPLCGKAFSGMIDKASRDILREPHWN